MVKYQNFWCRTSWLKDVIHFQKHFKAQNSNIILATQPKNGTTWLKSLLFTIVNRSNPDHQPLHKNSPLLSHNPHELVYFLEHAVYGGEPPFPNPQQLQNHPSPRLLQTHIPYASLPESIKTNSSCKIVCVARNPFDTFVSLWHWHGKLVKIQVQDPNFQPPSVEDFFEDFCQGKFPFGPYFDHNLQFWKQSIQELNKVLFLKFEDLKSDHAVLHVKKLADLWVFRFLIRRKRRNY
ncbi:Cytosolic sulfotransferase 15 [Bienertia sinuspersici]